MVMGDDMVKVVSWYDWSNTSNKNRAFVRGHRGSLIPSRLQKANTKLRRKMTKMKKVSESTVKSTERYLLITEKK
ncbi:hypothetical protein L1887_31372 [Cichorium endivia]|nr:hypothetical protein L1887_31372 [Cichorium endivia]